ncbi:3'-5' exonuclease [Shewanella surugensis]|uniref:3'-5' exoribonuclease n=1 Tax=Shewanella surugensis TaxID=212020 RepID=A0ABT0LE53_9GAMM|nr:3'-5' exonuclease [Shewanella surugensis]MCL1125607.1 3'-5' exoribonuclease [Shewanella surugensis]
MRILNKFKLSPLVALIDIKTFGHTENAVIASMACVIVNVVKSRVVDECYIRCQTEFQTNRALDEASIAFWRQQRFNNPNAWQELFSPNMPRQPLEQALQHLSNFIHQHFPTNSVVQIMGNRAEFDNVILSNAYQQTGVKQPWFEHENQSLASMIWLAKMLFGYDPQCSIPFKGTQHLALHDAQHQAKVLLAIMDKLFMCTADHLEAEIA